MRGQHKPHSNFGFRSAEHLDLQKLTFLNVRKRLGTARQPGHSLPLLKVDLYAPRAGLYDLR